MLKQIDPRELKARIEIAQAGYRDRKSGIDHFAASDPVSGRAVSKFIDGGTEVFQCSTPLDILPTYLEQIQRGYEPHPLSVVQIDHERFDIYFFKPAPIIQAALEQIAKDETNRYYAEIETHNAAFIESEVQAQLDIEERRVARELAEAAAKRRAEIEAEVRATYTPQPTIEVVKAPARGKR
jgi:hypothetical protein